MALTPGSNANAANTSGRRVLDWQHDFGWWQRAMRLMARSDDTTQQARHVRRARYRACALITGLLTLLGACATRSEMAYDASQPQTTPVRNLGNFNEALRCM